MPILPEDAHCTGTILILKRQAQTIQPLSAFFYNIESTYLMMMMSEWAEVIGGTNHHWTRTVCHSLLESSRFRNEMSTLPITMLFSFLLLLPAIFASNQVPLCSCSQANVCASEGSDQLDSCKKECANWLHTFAEGKKTGSAEALTNCFWKEGGIEGDRLTKCISAKVPNYCANGANNNASMLSNPDYSQWMEELVANSTAGKSGSAFIRKARSAFIVFRNFQKCMNNCAKRHSTDCFNAAGCAVSLPEERKKSLAIYNLCTMQNVHKDAREACRCLIQQHKVYQLVGVCPLFSDSYLMRTL